MMHPAGKAGACGGKCGADATIGSGRRGAGAGVGGIKRGTCGAGADTSEKRGMHVGEKSPLQPHRGTDTSDSAARRGRGLPSLSAAKKKQPDSLPRQPSEVGADGRKPPHPSPPKRALAPWERLSDQPHFSAQASADKKPRPQGAPLSRGAGGRAKSGAGDPADRKPRGGGPRGTASTEPPRPQERRARIRKGEKQTPPAPPQAVSTNGRKWRRLRTLHRRSGRSVLKQGASKEQARSK